MLSRTACLALGAWLAGCGFSGKLPTSGESRPDARPGDVLWRIETDADFTAAGHVADRIAIVRGVAEPFAYTYGALRVWGSNEALTVLPDASTWAMLQGVPPAQRSGFALTTMPGNATRRPGGLAFDDDDNWTMWGEGEIWLEAGANLLYFTVDDFGLVEIDRPDGTVMRLATTFGPTASTTFDAPVDGWYPIRVAMTQNTGASYFRLEVDPVGTTPRHRVEPWRLRTAVNDLAGTFMVVADEGFLNYPSASDLYEDALVSEDWATGRPSDLGVTDINYYSVRWSGQLLIDAAAEYTLRARTDDGHRLWVDAQLVSDQWTEQAAFNLVTPTLALTPGWHDIVYQMTEGTNDARAILTVESGPSGVGQPLPASRLRPVTGVHSRLAAASANIGTLFDASHQFRLTAGPGATTTYVQTGIVADHPDWNGIDVALDPPNASAFSVVAGSFGMGGAYIFFENRPLGGAVDGTWNFTFTDSSAANNGTAVSASLSIEYSGGHPAIDLASRWTSPVHDLGDDVAVSELVWNAHLPAPSTLVMEVRACDDPACDGESWTAVASPGPLPQPLAPARYTQVQLRMTTDGAVSPWVDWIDLVAR